MIQQQLRALDGNGQADRADIQRILSVVNEMQGDHRLTKVIFACKSLAIWREYDLAGDYATRLEIGNSFAIAPLAAEEQSRKRYAIVLADRNNARLLLLESRQLTEQSEAFEEEDREKIRTTGARKSVHLERKKEESAREHFTTIANRLLHFREHGDFDYLLVGCRDEMWPEIEAELHDELKRVFVGRFRLDPALASHEEIAQLAQSVIDGRDRDFEANIVEKIMGGALSERLGATGLESVMDALEKGEVRTLVWTTAKIDHPQSDGVSNCPNCGHLERGRLGRCELCATDMQWFARDEEALVRHALGRNIDVRMLHYAGLPPPDEIGAWLRFQAEHSTAQALAG
jgi:peptide subunit release factor 1 (eRF1)